MELRAPLTFLEIVNIALSIGLIGLTLAVILKLVDDLIA